MKYRRGDHGETGTGLAEIFGVANRRAGPEARLKFFSLFSGRC